MDYHSKGLCSNLDISIIRFILFMNYNDHVEVFSKFLEDFSASIISNCAVLIDLTITFFFPFGRNPSFVQCYLVVISARRTAAGIRRSQSKTDSKTYSSILSGRTTECIIAISHQGGQSKRMTNFDRFQLANCAIK